MVFIGREKAAKGRLYWIAVMMLSLLIGLLAVQVWAQTQAGFADPEAVAAYLDGNPELSVRFLEETLTAEQLAALEARMFPPADNTKLKGELIRVRRELTRLGLTDSDGVIQAIDTRIDTLGAGGS